MNRPLNAHVCFCAPSLSDDPPAMYTVSELLQARAADCADRIFCEFNGTKLTFSELLNGVQEMAGVLHSAGVVPGSRVGYMMPSSLEHIQLYLAASWIGACAVPFSVHLKSTGLELQILSSQPKVMVASRAFAAHLLNAVKCLPTPPRLLWLEDGAVDHLQTTVAHELRSGSTIRHPSPRSLDDPIAISYTSGTTGAPKGVIMSERFYWVGAKNAGLLSEAHAGDTYFMWEPFFHVAAWMTILMGLQHGLRIYMVDRFSASRLWDEIATARATKFHYLGGLVNIMLSQPVVDAERDNTLSIAWGAACPADSWRRFEERFGVKVREGYGISEGQNFTHVNMQGVIGSIGRPVPEFESWIADESGRPAPAGTVGEIVLKPLVPGITMSGYFGEPLKTREVLRDDGCVYTGDTGYQDIDGNFFFKGRKKDALRRRGENVSAWEVERVLNQAPGVEESAVVGVDSAVGEQDILAIVKFKDGARPDPLALLEFCNDRLAYYQVPRYVKVVSEFPRGPTQRIRKGELDTSTEQAFDCERAGWRPKRDTSGG